MLGAMAINVAEQTVAASRYFNRLIFIVVLLIISFYWLTTVFIEQAIAAFFPGPPEIGDPPCIGPELVSRGHAIRAGHKDQPSLVWRRACTNDPDLPKNADCRDKAV